MGLRGGGCFASTKYREDGGVVAYFAVSCNVRRRTLGRRVRVAVRFSRAKTRRKHQAGYKTEKRSCCDADS